MQIAVVTNGFTKVQHKNLEDCNLLQYIDRIITSEEAGVSKPDKRIFEISLDKCSVAKGDVVMIGDSLTNDIEGTTVISKPIELLEII
ncbi:MAG: HAD-IA family hydrolase [Paenibacillaceae bacterium]